MVNSPENKLKKGNAYHWDLGNVWTICTVEYIADMQDIGVIANIKYKKVIRKFKNFRFRPFYGKLSDIVFLMWYPGPVL